MRHFIEPDMGNGKDDNLIPCPWCGRLEPDGNEISVEVSEGNWKPICVVCAERVLTENGNSK